MYWTSKTFNFYRQCFDSYRECIRFIAADMTLITDVSAAMKLTCNNVSQITEKKKTFVTAHCLFYEHLHIILLFL